MPEPSVLARLHYSLLAIICRSLFAGRRAYKSACEFDAIETFSMIKMILRARRRRANRVSLQSEAHVKALRLLLGHIHLGSARRKLFYKSAKLARLGALLDDGDGDKEEVASWN